MPEIVVERDLIFVSSASLIISFTLHALLPL